MPRVYVRVNEACVCSPPRRAATALNTHCKGRRAEMTSQGCRTSRPTTGCCLSWVRMPRRRRTHLIGPKELQSRRYFTFTQTLSVAGRGFNNLSQVNMARHLPTGQLVAIKQTNLDECTEEELLQLMVSLWPRGGGLLYAAQLGVFGGDVSVPLRSCLIVPQTARTRSCCPGCSVTSTC